MRAAINLPGAAKPRILVVENEAVIARHIADQLRELGHEVVGTCNRGEDAVERMAAEDPDLVLMDIRLAGSGGPEVARALIEERPGPVVVVAAYSDKELVARAGGIGVYGYFVKPGNARDLQAQSEVALRRVAV